MSLLNAKCFTAFSNNNINCNRNNETMSTINAFDRTRVLKSILQKLASTSSQKPNDEVMREDSTSAAPPLQLSENVTIQCPSLSLQSDVDHTMTTRNITHHPTKDRTQAKDHAIKLLARQMTFVHHLHFHDERCSMRNNTASCVDATIESPETTRSIFASVGRNIQQNVFASFALLVNRRLNAYTAVMTRHAIVSFEDSRPVNRATDCNDGSLVSYDKAGEEEDVVNSKHLLFGTEARALTSNFQLLPQKHHDTSTVNDGNQTTAFMGAPIVYSVTMELHIPDEWETEKIKIVPVSFSTNGFIKCKLLYS